MIIINALPGAISQGLVWGIMALGLFLSYKILDFADLTVDGSICTGAAVSAVLITNGVHWSIALVVALLAGMLCGTVTGLLHTAMGIPAILSGILTQLALWSINLKIIGKANMSVSAHNYDLLISGTNNGKTILVMLGVTAVLVGILYWFFGTQVGCSIRATGCNVDMAKAQGINTNATKILALAISNGLVALSGGLLCQYQGFADINMGRGAIIIGLAAVIIGGAIVSKLSSNFAVQMCGVVVGSIVYYLVYQVVTCLGLDTDLLKLLSAVVVAIFLSIPHFKNKFRHRKTNRTSANTHTDISEGNNHA